MSQKELELHDLLQQALESLGDNDVKAQINRMLFGRGLEQDPIEIPESEIEKSKELDFDLKVVRLPSSEKEQSRPERKIRVAAIQNQIILPTDAPLREQGDAIRERIGKMLDTAGACGTNVVCLQESWATPFFFCTMEKKPWLEFAEDPYEGISTRFLSEYAKRWKMVIISPILERDSKHAGTIWNTAVVIDTDGSVVGISRKNHIPRVGAFAESRYYAESTLGHPVFELPSISPWGNEGEPVKIAINICYGRHFPQNWSVYAANGADVIFNPSATVGALSEPLWGIEARNAAIANNVYTVAINRVGTETYPREFTTGDGKDAGKAFGHFYGSSFVAGPDGSRTPSLSRVKDGLIVTEVDLNLMGQYRDNWTFNMSTMITLSKYNRFWTSYEAPGFQPQIVKKGKPQELPLNER